MAKDACDVHVYTFTLRENYKIGFKRFEGCVFRNVLRHTV